MRTCAVLALSSGGAFAELKVGAVFFSVWVDTVWGKVRP